MIGSSLGHYEILEPLGAGGMGEVYRARDTQLDRDVALKVLPAEFAADSDRLARFQQEAKTLATLNHPHIAQVFGLETADTPVIVMELVEGRDLSKLLDAGPLPLDDALAIARQVTEALSAAHDAGVVHRDLKPANVQVRDDGTVKVLDFGLAKASEGSGAAESGLSQSPTIMSPAMTATGMIMGTAAYMSPEQAKGRPVDRRADLWAFGCVLYEMLTGTRPFRGDDVAETLASVLKDEVDFGALPAGTPTSVHRLLRRCLRRDPAERLDSAAAARLEIVEAAIGISDPLADATARTPTGRVAWALAGLAIGIAVASLAVWAALPAPRTPRVLALPQPGDVEGAVISPDGRYAAMAREPAGVYLRDLESGEERLISEEGYGAAWTPGSDRLAFSGMGSIWVYTLASDSAVAVADMPQGPSAGLSWGADDRLVGAFFSPRDGAGLWAFDATRPGARELILPTRWDGDWPITPHLLPDGAGILYAVGSQSDPDPIGRIEVFDGEQTHVLIDEPGARIDSPIYSPTGHLLYRRTGETAGVWARPFSLRTLQLEGPAVRLSEHAGAPSLAADGTLLLSTVGRSWIYDDVLVGVKHPDGRHEPLGLPFPSPRWMALSPDGSRVALVRNVAGLYVQDFARGSTVRLAAVPGHTAGTVPFWHPTGDQIGYPVQDAEGARAIVFVDAAGGEFVADPLEDATRGVFTADGARLVFVREGKIWIGGPRGENATQFPGGTGRVQHLALAANDAFIAYESLANSGEQPVSYVERFPDGGDRVALGESRSPRFGAGDRSLFFVGRRQEDGRSFIQSVAFDPTGGVVVGEPRDVVPVDGLEVTRNWDLLPDDRVVTALMVPPTGADANILLIEDWLRLLER